jgi:hypothetical protein
VSRLRKTLPYALFALLLVVAAYHATLSAFAARYCPPLQKLALWHLASLGERALPYILDFLGADDPGVRKIGQELLESVKSGADWSSADPQILEKAVERFRSETDPAIRKQLTAVVAASNSQGAVQALSEGAKDPALRNACAGALSEIAARAPEPHLQEAARQASTLAGSEQAGRLLSSTVDAVRGVASPLAGVVDTVMGKPARPVTPTATAPAAVTPAR